MFSFGNFRTSATIIRSILKMPRGIYERTSIKRGKYSRYSQTDKDAIIKAFNDEKDWKSVAEAMSIKQATAITWIRNGGITKPKGGAIVVKKEERIVRDRFMKKI